MAREGKAGITVDQETRDDLAEHKRAGETWDELFERVMATLSGDGDGGADAPSPPAGSAWTTNTTETITVDLLDQEGFIDEVATRMVEEVADSVEVRIDAETLAKRVNTRIETGATASEVEEIVRDTTRREVREALSEATQGMAGHGGGV